MPWRPASRGRGGGASRVDLEWTRVAQGGGSMRAQEAAKAAKKQQQREDARALRQRIQLEEQQDAGAGRFEFA